ncbi:iron ABC transporter permease [Porphyromonas sp. COT-108 OH2963]|uniref:FecCD family ABC transporter permease n=1 Tax=Porphyromonas sp. COT-108 OH2963 TaxID=1515614 RepID=UPI00052B8FDA|nr:iron ABC transporter permease [Porphyromonas sp. COT-108 OH2963]KGN95205.1 iron ABC transporter permease [Porphyromonas sp. COT-108 OH2963]
MRTAKYGSTFAIPILIVSLVGVLLLSLSIGEISIPFWEWEKILQDPDSMEYGILTYIRLPRALLGLAVGGALSLAGVVLQGIYRNPLVEPYTLGISGGASLGVTFAIVSGLHAVTILFLPLAGFIGALLTIFLVYTLSLQRGYLNITRMLLIGVMISFISSSLMMFLMSVTDVENIHGIVFWIMGSLNESNTMLWASMLILSILSLGITYLFTTPLNALRLGEEKAMHLGINANTTIRILFITTSLLTGACIAVAGVIGFVGLVIPHIVRLWVGTDYRKLLLTSYLAGSVFLILSDVVARTIIAPNELPIGVITGIIGGAAFILILVKSKYGNK